MKLARETVWLRAYVNALNIEDDAGEKRSHRFRDRDRLAVCSNHDGTALYLVPFGRAEWERDLPEGRARGKSLFKAFTGYEVYGFFRVEVPDSATTLYKCGYALSIVYTSDKARGGGKGHAQKFIHTFEEPPPVYCDRKKDPRVFGILRTDGKRIVEGRGIVG